MLFGFKLDAAYKQTVGINGVHRTTGCDENWSLDRVTEMLFGYK
jgi:hypothetical protein